MKDEVILTASVVALLLFLGYMATLASYENRYTACVEKHTVQECGKP